jgi:diguanylate cyclase (GGDEF)-like protein/PAS domain S-box-containing protein
MGGKMVATQILFYYENGQSKVHSSQGFSTLLGYNDQLLEDGTIPFKDLIHPDDHDIYENIFKSETSLQTLSINFRIRHSNGKIICVMGLLDRTYAVGNQHYCIDLTLKDVKTLPRTMEDAASTLAFKLMMETTDDFIYFKDRNHVFTGASASLAALFKSIKHWSDLVGLTDYDVFEESLADEYYRLEKEVFSGAEIASEVQHFVTKEGKNGWVDNRKYPIKDSNGHIIGLYGIARDITQTHLLEERLREEHATLQLILDYAPVGIWLQNGKGKLSFVNRAFTQAMGIEEKDFLDAEHYIHMISEPFRLQCLASDAKALQSDGISVTFQELPFVDGKVHDLKVIKAIQCNDNNEVTALIGISLDVTEELKQQEVLIQSESRFRSIFNQIENIAVQGYDENRNVIYWNNASERIYGYRADEVMGQDFTKLIVPLEMRSFVVQAHSDWLNNDIPIPASELELLTKKGSLVSVFSSHVMLTGLDGKKEMYCIDLDLTEFKKTSKALEENQKLLRTVIDEMPSVLVVKDANGNFVLGNKTIADLYGTTPEQMIGKHDDDFGVPKEIADGFRENVLSIMAKGETEIVVEDSRDAITGEIRHFKSIKKPFIDSDGNQQILVIATDITEILEAQKKVIESKHILQEVMEIAHEGIWDWHIPSGKVTHNHQWYVILKLDADKYIDTVEAFESILHPDDKILVKERLSALLNGSASVYYSEHRMICSDGSEIWVQDRGDVIERDANGYPIRIVGAFTDITYQKKHQNELEYMAHYDMLTGLPNRSLEADRLKQAMSHVKRMGGYIAVIYLDLDGFKEINDTYGHDTGDLILINVSKNMSQLLRDEDTISRLGGDEFVVIIPDLNSKDEALDIVQRLLEQAAKLVTIDERLISLSASAGITFYPQTDDVDGDQLIRQADLAMYQAKQAGKNRYHIFDTEKDRVTRRQHETYYHIEKALNNDEFVLHYQPKVNMRTKEIIGAEALIRWNHPTRGLLYPMEFLPMIENSVLASKIGEWVIDTALNQIAAWTSLGYTIPVSVNVGATQLLKSDFIEQLKYLLNKHISVDPKMLEIEILETSALEDMQMASKIIRECSKLKIHFSLDDFGTGYSSLSYLKRLPVTTLKIDQSFIRDILNDLDDRLIVIGIIGLAKAFGKNLVAEGVESEEIAAKLVTLGCDFGQGYGISRPISSSDFLLWLKHQ